MPINRPLNIVTLGKEDWANPRRARKQLLFEALLRQPGLESVLYVNPHLHRWQLHGEPKIISNPRLHVWQGTFLLPGERFPLIRKINRFYIYEKLREQFGPSTILHTFYYNPLDVSLVKHLQRHGPAFFDWTEDWGVYHSDALFDTAQEEAVKTASGVVVVTESLEKRVRNICGESKKVLLLPNATAWEHLQIKKCPEDIAAVSGPRIGFCGHLGPWIDKDLIVQLSKVRPDWEWILVGGADQKILNFFQSYSNIHILGQRPFHELQQYMAQCQVLVAPYISHLSGDATKLYDYLTLGSPIVSSEIETAYRLQPYVRIASGLQSWLHLINDALNESDESLRQSRQKASLQHTWDIRASVMLNWIKKFPNV